MYCNSVTHRLRKKIVIYKDEIESQRFGIRAAKVEDIRISDHQIENFCADNQINFLSVRISADETSRVRFFESIGFRIMDCLVHYALELDGYKFSAGQHFNDKIAVRPATFSDSAAAAAISRRAFKDYIGHFHADPRLDKTQATEVYAQWAENCISDPSGETLVLVAELDTELAGFLAIKTLGANNMDIRLNAVSPKAQGQGCYKALLQAAIRYASNQGSKRLFISTQINNYRVQRIWSLFGFFPVESFFTLHKWRDN